MTYISEKNYMYIETFNLEADETEHLIRNKLSDFILKPYKIYINCVKNKNMEKLGYSYGWINNTQAFNILVGLNQDGTERVEYTPDPNWVQTEKVEKSDFSWADEVDERPMVKTYLDSLVNFENKIIIKEAFIINNFDTENIIFTKNIDKRITKNMLYNFFKQFEKDDIQKDRYPHIKFKEKNSKTMCLVKFSPRYPHTASFVINLVKKKNFNNILCFFSQTKKHVKL